MKQGVNRVLSTISSITSFILKPFSCLLSITVWFILPTKMKRILFMASLHVHMKGVNISSLSEFELEEYLSQLNNEFNLTTATEKAMLLPLTIHDYIWRDFDKKTLPFPTMSHCSIYQELILKSTPLCLYYNRKKMEKDAESIFCETRRNFRDTRFTEKHIDSSAIIKH